MSTRGPNTIAERERAEPSRPRHPSIDDTNPDVRARLIEGYRAMGPADKIERVVALNRAVEALAAAGIRSRQEGALSSRELRLRLASLRLPRATMVRVFGWDPAQRGPVRS